MGVGEVSDGNPQDNSDPLAGLSEAGKRFLGAFPREKRERYIRNMDQVLPGTVQSACNGLPNATERTVPVDGVMELEVETKTAASTPRTQNSIDPYCALIALGQVSKGCKEAHARIPRELMATPQYGKLSANGLRTLNALWLYCNQGTGMARPGHKILIKRLGMIETPTVQKRIKRGIVELKSLGLAWAKSKAYPGHAAEYFLARNQRQIDFILSINGGHIGSPKLGDHEGPS